MATIKHFPGGQKGRRKLSFNKNQIGCQVSERWLQFPKVGAAMPDGTYMIVQVMTKGSSDSDRKICEVVLVKEQLLELLAKIDAE